MNNHIQYFLWVRLSYYALLFDTLCKRGAWLTKLPWKLDTSAQLHPTDNYAMELLTHALISDNLRPLVLVEEVNCYYRVPHVISSPDLLLYGYLRRACLWLICINCGTPAWKTISQPPCTTPTTGDFACYWGYTRDNQWWEFPPVMCIVITQNPIQNGATPANQSHWQVVLPVLLLCPPQISATNMPQSNVFSFNHQSKGAALGTVG